MNIKNNKFIAILATIVIIASAFFIANQVRGVALGGNLIMSGYQIQSLGCLTGSPGCDAANKNYVDSVAELSIIENRDNITGDPTGAELVTGKIWICTDAGGDCQ